MQRRVPGVVGQGIEASPRAVPVAELDSPVAPAVGLVNSHVDMGRMDSIRAVEVRDEALHDPAVEGEQHSADDLITKADLDHVVTVTVRATSV